MHKCSYLCVACVQLNTVDINKFMNARICQCMLQCKRLFRVSIPRRMRDCPHVAMILTYLALLIAEDLVPHKPSRCTNHSKTPCVQPGHVPHLQKHLINFPCNLVCCPEPGPESIYNPQASTCVANKRTSHQLAKQPVPCPFTRPQPAAASASACRTLASAGVPEQNPAPIRPRTCLPQNLQLLGCSTIRDASKTTDSLCKE